MTVIRRLYVNAGASRSARGGDAKMMEEGAGDHGRQCVTTDGRGDWQGALRLRRYMGR
jgi:hypothetical protein